MSVNTLKGYTKDQGWILFVILLCLFADSELISTWSIITMNALLPLLYNPWVEI